jgi:hypothetical protein
MKAATAIACGGFLHSGIPNIQSKRLRFNLSFDSCVRCPNAQASYAIRAPVKTAEF